VTIKHLIIMGLSMNDDYMKKTVEMVSDIDYDKLMEVVRRKGREIFL
jgi:hypothetical protein